MGRPLTPEMKAATEAAKKLAQSKERQQHMAAADMIKPTGQPAIDAPLPSLDPNAGQS